MDINYKITSPESSYNGIGEGGIIFANGVATTDSYYIANLYRKKGYTIDVIKTDTKKDELIYSLSSGKLQEEITNGEITLNLNGLNSGLTPTVIGGNILNLSGRTENKDGKIKIIFKDFELKQDSDIYINAKGAGVFYSLGNLNIYNNNILHSRIELARLTQINSYLRVGSNTLELPQLSASRNIKLSAGTYNLEYETWNPQIGNWYINFYLENMEVIKRA